MRLSYLWRKLFSRHRRRIPLVNSFTTQPIIVWVLRRRIFRVHSNLENQGLPLLYVDHKADERLLFQEAIRLTKTPFRLLEADCPQSAMPFFEPQKCDAEQRPALVLLDYDLGNQTGAEFLYWLRSIKKLTSVPVIMFSDSVGNPHVAECYSTGVNSFLSKPKDLGRLKSIIRTLYLSMVCKAPNLIVHLQEYQPDPRQNAQESRLIA